MKNVLAVILRIFLIILFTAILELNHNHSGLDPVSHTDRTVADPSEGTRFSVLPWLHPVFCPDSACEWPQNFDEKALMEFGDEVNVISERSLRLYEVLDEMYGWMK